jgi:hypothetical protein
MSNDKRTVHRETPAEPDSRASTEAQADPIRGEALPPSAEELAALLREDAMANALPTPPKIPGWHSCWLSTTNTYTPIQHYIRLGYVPVKPEEIPAWQYLKQHSAQIGDTITCNEMVLYKVTDSAYQQIMKTVHHDKPNAEAERLKANVDMMKDEHRDSEGNQLIHEEGDGVGAVLDRKVRVGEFQ